MFEPIGPKPETFCFEVHVSDACKLQAMVIIRNAFGCDLKQAKEIVDACQTGAFMELTLDQVIQFYNAVAVCVLRNAQSIIDSEKKETLFVPVTLKHIEFPKIFVNPFTGVRY